ncbi:flagellar L-ring protein precursor FlgH [Novosphingobium sp. PhB165]|uniref:flagellar basal body L-ring protein FlgH n=1 Tax=Novosphingobium sp. PhB165 TaxID=2485105 RepID=UPI00104D09D5|nr:flagellar basal body L-ring protein FlgH [Novosphingobium sp. PhB165]TCM18875.1 flagellar L-ring protein precursor FlgH [Novosphingobium sp. PhB165]
MLSLSKHLSHPRLLKAATIALLLAALPTSPALAEKKPPKPSGFEPTLPAPLPETGVQATGGIFSASLGYAPLHSGTRAARVGDPVTIVLVESTTAAKSVSSKSQKGGGASITPPTKGPLSFLNPDALKASSSSTFNGQGDAAQTSSLRSTLSVTIAEIRPNGTALVRGEKKMLVSQGDEWIRFSGIVRLADIDEDNQIASTRVADAKIEYTGKGSIMRSGRQGWLGQFFNMISPF